MLEIPELKNYVGSKNAPGVYHRIISEMPPHRVYIENHLGSGAILRRKKPASINIGIDANPKIIDIWTKYKSKLEFDFLPQSSEAIKAIDADYLNDKPFGFLPSDVLIYADPPYLMETRSSQRKLYEKEFDTPEQHKRLAKYLKTLNCNVILSGYRSKLYDELFPDWRTIDIPTRSRGGNKIETIWLNFPPPIALHDTRFLGKNNREREALERKKKNLKAKLLRMKPVERFVLMEVVKDLEIELQNER